MDYLPLAIFLFGIVAYGFVKGSSKPAAANQTVNTSAKDELPAVFQTIVDVGQVFSYVKVSKIDEGLSVGLSTNSIQESKLALEEVKLLKTTVQNAKREVKAEMTSLRQAYQNKIANRGAMIPGGGKFGMVARFGIRAVRASERAGVSDVLKTVQDTVVNPLDDLLLHCDKLKVVLKKEIMAG
jgi:hypothetical protein